MDRSNLDAAMSASEPMTTAHATTGLALAALLAAGCSSASAERARDQRRMIAALTEARDAVCACGDLACAEDAEGQLANFLLLHVDRLKKLPVPAASAVEAIATQAAQLDGELRACKHRLEEAARAS